MSCLFKKPLHVFLLLFGVAHFAHAEVEDENEWAFDDQKSPFLKPTYNKKRDEFLATKVMVKGVDHDETEPLNLPKFINPFELSSDDDIKQKMPVLPSSGKGLHVARELQGERSIRARNQVTADVEIWLPQNRCELGWVQWGSMQEGFRECKVLGRGETVFGTLKLLAGLKATQSKYRTWSIGELPAELPALAIKNKEHFATASNYSHCMFRPESEVNGATITTRPASTIGTYFLETGPNLHRGKDKWGRALEGERLLLPIRMNKIEDSRNQKYAKEGRLIFRDDFWLHSYENKKDELPLEAHSTWGCPRLPRACMQEIQEWVHRQNALGKKPRMVVRQE